MGQKELERFELYREFDSQYRRRPNQTKLVQGYKDTLAHTRDDDAAIKAAKERAALLKQIFVDSKNKGKTDALGTKTSS